MVRRHWVNEKIRYFLLGALVVIGIILLTGAAPDKQPVLENGRFQISSWGDETRFGAFVVDTVTGKTKIVYHYKELANGKFLEKDNLNKPFSTME
jgi:hypothetical protein